MSLGVWTPGGRWAKLRLLMVLLAALAMASCASPLSRQSYFGSLIGKLNRRDHNVSGDVYAVDEQTLFIRAFNYDGLAPDAYFWSSVSSAQPAAADGFIVPDEKGSTKPLERYVDKDIVLRLPEGKTLREINWLCVWSRQRRENSGEIMIGRNLPIPRPLEIAPLSQLAHGLKSGPITIVDAQTFLVPDFHYDGLGPAAYFWLTRGGQGLSANGLRLKDENGSSNPLRKYTGETVVISLPDELTIYDFDFFGVWCKEFQVNFGQTRIPQSAKVPPSPKMLGIKPENKLNCEILYDDLGYEIRWVLDGDDIVMQLVGKVEPGEYMAFGLGKDDSRSDMSNADAVVTWVDRATGQVHAVDYFLGAKQQCTNDPKGSCPDVKLAGGGDSLTLLHGAIVNGYSMVTFKRPQLGIDELYDQHVYSDGQQSVLWAIGSLNAKKEIGYHRLRTRANMFIDFARNPQWNCPIPDLNASMHGNLPLTSASQLDPTVVSAQSAPEPGEQSSSGPSNRQATSGASEPDIARVQQQQQQSAPIAVAAPALAQPQGQSERPPAQNLSQRQPLEALQSTGGLLLNNRSAGHNDPWLIPSIVCPSDRTFYAQIGPTAAHKGYEGLTGRTSWGISWYVNGLMIPELVVERGQTYRFVVEGGNDKTSATHRHPLYLTDSPEGGFDFKTDEQRLKERIFAGVAIRADGQFVPTAEGRLCEWKQTNATLPNPDLYSSFAAYQRTLKLDCLPGQASMLKFTPDSTTPDLIYYQCYTYRYLGWRIKVVNSCASYLASLAQTQRAVGNNNVKRDTIKAQKESVAERATYDRRFSLILGADDPLKAAHSEPRISFESGQGAFPLADFGDDPSASFTTELSTYPNDALLLNNSHLLHRPPPNITSLDQILKLSPADLEFIDNQSESPLEAYFQAPFASIPLPLHNFSTSNVHEQQRANNRTSKQPKTLQAYMRRLASIYYPVQQQLASMLASQSLPLPLQLKGQTQQPSGSNQIQSASSDQSSSFSLASLVPKPKIDLSKSTITKKLNKLRFKSGRKYEPAQGKPNQPPTPANEFNYDIFNNQLAQLEQQQKQFQSLEMANWPLQQASELLNYLPMVSTPQAIDDQQAIDSINLQSQMFLNNALGSQQSYANSFQSKQPIVANTYQQATKTKPHIQQQQQQQPASFFKQPIRYSETPLGPPNHLGNQPYVIDYLSMMFNRSTDSTPPNQMNQEYGNNQQKPLWLSAANSQGSGDQRSKQQQPSVYITRLPQQHGFPIYPDPQQRPPQNSHHYQQIQYQPQQQRPQQQPQIQQHDGMVWSNEPGGGSARYPSIQPYGGGSQLRYLSKGEHSGYGEGESGSNQMSTMPSVSLTIHNTQEGASSYPTSSASPAGEMESLSGSGSGSYYDFRQQPVTQTSNQITKSSEQQDSFREQPANGDTDHMLAIERFSKQSSERRAPSIVHPVTGEQVNLADKNTLVSFNDEQHNAARAAGSNASGSGAQPRRYSAMLIDKHLIAPDGPSHFLSQETMESDQTMQHVDDLQRINASVSGLQGFSNFVLVSADPNKIQRTGVSANASQIQQQSGDTSCVRSDPGTKIGCQRHTTTESVPQVLVKPSIYDSYHDQTISTTPTSGPLTPSLGPPISPPLNSIPRGNNNVNDVKQVAGFSSSLVEPASSNFIYTPSLNFNPYSNGNSNNFVNRFNLDSSPFTPIEMATSPFYASQQQQISASDLLASRLRPSPLIESMIVQHQSPSRPEPPVQVASYLAQQLISHNPMYVTSEKSVASTRPVALSVSLSASSGNQEQTRGEQNITSNLPSTNDLIILKPAILTKQTPQTYLLKPEYMTNQFKQIDADSSAENDVYSSGSADKPTRRLAGHQFDRLSSLSSPPSTSIALDPMLASNTITTFVKQTNNNATSTDLHTKPTNSHTATSGQPSQPESASQPKSTTASNYSSKTESSIGGSVENLAQHRQSYIPTKPIPLNLEPPLGSSPEGVRVNAASDGSNTLYRDNNTDNAILSHVMSLISSNAIPTPPLIPVASYSSADYFLPSSDRVLRSIRG